MQIEQKFPASLTTHGPLHSTTAHRRGWRHTPRGGSIFPYPCTLRAHFFCDLGLTNLANANPYQRWFLKLIPVLEAFGRARGRGALKRSLRIEASCPTKWGQSLYWQLADTRVGDHRKGEASTMAEGDSQPHKARRARLDIGAKGKAACTSIESVLGLHHAMQH